MNDFVLNHLRGLPPPAYRELLSDGDLSALLRDARREWEGAEDGFEWCNSCYREHVVDALLELIERREAEQ